MLDIPKIKLKFWYTAVIKLKGSKLYPFIYRSYWNTLFYKNKKLRKNTKQYLSVKPTPNAGIGHQVANWISCYWYSRKFGLNFSHVSFSNPTWDSFLGFGEGEDKYSELINNGYIKRRLPLFEEDNKEEVERIKKIIHSYSGKKVIFVCEYNQFYHDQYGVMSEMQEKFYSATSRLNDNLIYDKENFNIAIHVRRGDILNDSNNPNLKMRFIANDYFRNVLGQVLQKIRISKPIHIYFFSQGKQEDFSEFEHFEYLHWCLDMNARDSFLHMVYADLLITSKSSFSYKPALLNYGIKVCPMNFWHGYPDTKDWILADNDGNINVDEIKINDL